MGSIRKTPPASIRFARRLRPDGDCVLWTGAVGSHGYGNFWDGERHILAHRFAYEQGTGDRLVGGKRGDVVFHTCDRPLCCARAHLRKGTHAMNHADCRAKDRGPQFRRKAEGRAA